MENFVRTEWLVGKEALDKISTKHVAIFGLGGVGGYVCECLARTGISNFTICDFDTVSESNINRQIIATTKSIGNKKTDEIKNRIISINPEANVNIIDKMITKDNISSINFGDFDFVVDALDMVTTKILLIEKSKQFNKSIISCMGTGNKLNPLKLKISDIKETKECPLAKVMRRELKTRNISDVTVVWSEEIAKEPIVKHIGENKKQTPSSCVFVPATAGILIAFEIIKQIMEK